MGTLIKAKDIFETVKWIDSIRPLPDQAGGPKGQVICLLCNLIELGICPNCLDREDQGQHSGTWLLNSPAPSGFK